MAIFANWYYQPLPAATFLSAQAPASFAALSRGQSGKPGKNWI